MSERGRNLKVGFFVFSALMIGGILAFVIGNQRNLFRSKTEYRTVFDSVSGLRPGSPVLMAGVPVGTVSTVEIGKEDGKIHVELGVIEEGARFVREDSVASIGSKGMLGDKLVDLTAGKGKRLPKGGLIKSQPNLELADYAKKAEGLITQTEKVVFNVEKATAPFADPTFAENVKATTENLATLTDMAATEGGAFDALNKAESGKKIERTLTNLERLTGELASLTKTADSALRAIRSGDGGAHELLYGKSGKELVQNLSATSRELSLAMKEIRTGDGGANALIYGEGGGELVENLNASAADLRTIMGDIREGKGTIGGLLVDPSIYEDVKRLVGDLERNEVLKALVRYSIRQDDPQPSISVSE